MGTVFGDFGWPAGTIGRVLTVAFRLTETGRSPPARREPRSPTPERGRRPGLAATARAQGHAPDPRVSAENGLSGPACPSR